MLVSKLEGSPIFLLPLREKVRMRGSCNLGSSSHHSSPVKEEEARAHRRLVPLFLILIFILGRIALRPADAESIKIGLPSVTITAMPFFVAKEHGFFQQEGLTAEMVVMPASLNIKVLLAGEIQYAATIGSAVAAAIHGINVRTVMLFVDRPLLDLVGGPGIRSIGDVKGKIVALSSRGGLQDIVMRRMLTQ